MCANKPVACKSSNQHVTLCAAGWNSISTCHNSSFTWPNYNSKRTKTLLQCSREGISTLLNALTVHCLRGTYAHRLGLSNHDFCRSCKQRDEEESIEHLLCFCPAHSLTLSTILGVSIQKILCFLRRTKYFAKGNNPWAREKDLIRDHVVSQGAQCGLSVGIFI